MYIYKKWLPELSNIVNKDIHNWSDTWINYKDIKYYKPIIDHSEEKNKTLKIFKSSRV